jgi:hypothetical protein
MASKSVSRSFVAIHSYPSYKQIYRYVPICQSVFAGKLCANKQFTDINLPQKKFAARLFHELEVCGIALDVL